MNSTNEMTTDQINLNPELLKTPKNTPSNMFKINTEKFYPNFDDKFFFVFKKGSEYRISSTTKDHSSITQALINNTFVFPDKIGAEEYKHYLEVVDKYKSNFKPDWEDESQVKVELTYCNAINHIDARCSWLYSSSSTVHFKSHEQAKAFLDEAGEENVKHFMFNIWK